jgi:putative addiction module component (TIGR02574 family)
MSLTKEQVKLAAMQLSQDERQELVDELSVLSDAEQAEVDAAHVEESMRRYNAFLKDGKVGTPIEEVVARLRNSLHR